MLEKPKFGLSIGRQTPLIGCGHVNCALNKTFTFNASLLSTPWNAKTAISSIAVKNSKNMIFLDLKLFIVIALLNNETGQYRGFWSFGFSHVLLLSIVSFANRK